MGPLRRRLGAALALSGLSTPAWAETCAEMRPGWDGTPVSAFGALIYLGQSPFVLVLILRTEVAVRFRSEWGGLVVVVGWSVATYLVTGWGSGNTAQTNAMQEGCVGSPALFIAFAAALCIGVVLYTAPIGKNKQS